MSNLTALRHAILHSDELAIEFCDILTLDQLFPDLAQCLCGSPAANILTNPSKLHLAPWTPGPNTTPTYNAGEDATRVQMIVGSGTFLYQNVTSGPTYRPAFNFKLGGASSTKLRMGITDGVVPVSGQIEVQPTSDWQCVIGDPVDTSGFSSGGRFMFDSDNLAALDVLIKLCVCVEV